jgi:PhnB protein
VGDIPQPSPDQRVVLSPLLSVRNGLRAIEFYKAAFGADELFRVDDGHGSVVARLSIGKAEFWLADESPEHSNFSPESLGGSTVRMIMTLRSRGRFRPAPLSCGQSTISRMAGE